MANPTYRLGVFLKYSWRVHGIESMLERFTLCDSVFIYIATSRPTGLDLLPNLRRLNYVHGPTAVLPLFTHARFAQLQLSIEFMNWDKQDIRWLISYLPDRAPNLEDFRLRAVRSTDTVPELVLDMVIGSLPRLQKVLVSSSLLTPSLLHTLSLLRNLESLYVEYVASVVPRSLYLRSPTMKASPLSST